MGLNMPSLIQLEYIVKVADLKHFGKAAEACHITQPTLSQQIKKAEDELNLTLFDRLKKPVVTTPEGQRVVEIARSILSKNKELESLSKSRSDQPMGEYKLGIIPSVSNSLIPNFMDKFVNEYPKIQLSIQELTTQNIIESLKRDHLDGAVLATPLHERELLESPLYYEPFVIFASKNHSLLEKAYCKRSDLNEPGLWLLQDGHCFKKQIENFRSSNLQAVPTYQNVNYQSASLDTLIKLVERGNGFTLIPSFMLSDLSESKIKNHVRFFKAPIPGREISFVTRRSSWKSSLSSAIQSSILSSLPKYVKTKKDTALEVLEIC